MPNWCENFVTLTHSDTEKVTKMERVLDAYSTNDTFFEHYLPKPTHILDRSTLDWNVEVWGTKWEPEIFDHMKENTNTITISMNTAWAPPIGFYKKLVATGWNVDALYHEPGCEFCGHFTNDNDDYYEYNREDKSTYEDIPVDVLYFTGVLDEVEE